MKLFCTSIPQVRHSPPDVDLQSDRLLDPCLQESLRPARPRPPGGSAQSPRATTSTPYGHYRYDARLADQLTDAGYKLAVLIRDPRDIALSMADYY